MIIKKIWYKRKGDHTRLHPLYGPHMFIMSNYFIVEETEEDCTSGIINWSNPNTLLLIEEYRENKEKVEKGIIRKKKGLGENFIDSEKKGFSVSPDQVNDKWKTLMRSYKFVKDNNKKSGAGRKVFEFEEELDVLFQNDIIVKPVLTLSSTGKKKNKEVEKSNTSDDDDNEEKQQNKQAGPAPKKRKSASADMADTVKEYLQDLKRHQEEAVERQERMHRERLNVYKGVEDALRSLLTHEKKQ